MRKIILGALFLALCGFLFNLNAPNARAMTAEEIQALITQLQQQVAQLQKQLDETKEKPAVWCHTFNTNLKFSDGTGIYASKEDEVRNLQVALEKEGFDIDDNEQKGGSCWF